MYYILEIEEFALIFIAEYEIIIFFVILFY